MTVVSREASWGLAPGAATALGLDTEPLTAPPLELWPAEGQCFVAGRRVDLSRREFAVLTVLVSAPGHIITRERLYEMVSGGRLPQRRRDVDVHVRKVRVKLEAAAPGWVFIHTHFGFGYRLAPEKPSLHY